MSVKLITTDAKQLLARRMSEWRDLESYYGFEGRSNSMSSVKQAFLAKLREEVDKKMVAYWGVLQKTNDEPILVTGSSDAMKEIFKKAIKGVVVLCCNAFFEVRGLYSEEEAKLLVREEIRKSKSKVNYLKFCQETPNADLQFERLPIPESVRNEVWRRDEGKCARCKSVRNLEFDHIIPVSRGGSNTARNIQLLCEDCNRQKSNNIG